MHILVVEDEKALCDTIARSLRRLAYSVDCCYDGQSAAELLAVERFDRAALFLTPPALSGCPAPRTRPLRYRDTMVLTLPPRARSPIRWRGSMRARTTISPSPFISMSSRRASAA